MRGEQHLAFATNAKNYEALDELISQGTSFNDFLAKYTKATVVPQGLQLGVQQATVPDSKPSVVSAVSEIVHSARENLGPSVTVSPTISTVFTSACTLASCQFLLPLLLSTAAGGSGVHPRLHNPWDSPWN